MIDYRSLIRAYEGGANNPALRHVALNYSETETGLRNRMGPVGMINRDQGIFDAFAGRQRLMLGTDGSAVLLARWAAVVADYISLRPKSLKTFSILGRTFAKDVFEGRKLVTPLIGSDLSQYFVLDASGVPIPMSAAFEVVPVFEKPEVYGLQGASAEMFSLSDKAMRGN